jgi:hypothetical protein
MLGRDLVHRATRRNVPAADSAFHVCERVLDSDDS